jgi:hypothetical protein
MLRLGIIRRSCWEIEREFNDDDNNTPTSQHTVPQGLRYSLSPIIIDSTNLLQVPRLPSRNLIPPVITAVSSARRKKPGSVDASHYRRNHDTITTPITIPPFLAIAALTAGIQLEHSARDVSFLHMTWPHPGRGSALCALSRWRTRTTRLGD